MGAPLCCAKFRMLRSDCLYGSMNRGDHRHALRKIPLTRAHDAAAAGDAAHLIQGSHSIANVLKYKKRKTVVECAIDERERLDVAGDKNRLAQTSLLFGEPEILHVWIQPEPSATGKFRGQRLQQPSCSATHVENRCGSSRAGKSGE
jgi:hypothetical protein